MDPFDALHVEELVVDAETGLLWQVVAGVDACEEPVPLGRVVAEPAQDREELAGLDEKRRDSTVVKGLDDGAWMAVAKLVCDQLESGRVRHLTLGRAEGDVRVRQLLGSLGAIARAPALIRIALHLALQSQDSVDQR